MKNYFRILQKLYHEPCLILPEAHKTICETVWHHHTNEPVSFIDGIFDEDPPKLETVGSVGLVNVHGAISRQISNMERACGAVGVEDVQAMIQEGLDNPDVSALVLSIDSPGGGVTGVPELAEFIQAARSQKPIIAHTSGLMASAAYYLGSAASAVYATPSSTVGSIGTYIAFMDSSRAHEMHGLKPEVIKAGKFKAAGYPGTELTEDQRAQIQDHVDEINDAFQGFVIENRPAVEDSTMEGQTFTGATAQRLGLVDSLATLEEAIRDAHQLA